LICWFFSTNGKIENFCNWRIWFECLIFSQFEIGVGKTSFITKYIQNYYENSHEPTINDELTKKITIDGKNYLLTITDTSSCEGIKN
jgi:hypothetical protein